MLALHDIPQALLRLPLQAVLNPRADMDEEILFQVHNELVWLVGMVEYITILFRSGM